MAHSRCSTDATCSQEVAVNMGGRLATLLPTLVAQVSETVCPKCAQIPLSFLVPRVACEEGGV